MGWRCRESQLRSAARADGMTSNPGPLLLPALQVMTPSLDVPCAQVRGDIAQALQRPTGAMRLISSCMSGGACFSAGERGFKEIPSCFEEAFPVFARRLSNVRSQVQ